MKKPFAHLDARKIDEQIEQLLQTPRSPQSDDEDTCCLRDLDYLYRKEEILARVQQRLQITSLPEQTSAATAEMPMLEYPTTPLRPRAAPIRQTFSWSKLAAVLAAAILLIGALLGITKFFALHAAQTPTTGHNGGKATVTATPTIPASTILFSDPLSQNIHDWPVVNTGPQQHFFKDGAYHLLANGGSGVGVMVPQTFSETSLTYQITMEEIKGSDTSQANIFGMILYYSEQTIKGQRVETFYNFDILNQGGSSRYQMYKYSNARSYPWIQIDKSVKAGKEFHSGHGPNAVNTIKISVRGNIFTAFVNGQQVMTVKDSFLASNARLSGKMGMLVNLKGTEVAFTNMLITRP